MSKLLDQYRLKHYFFDRSIILRIIYQHVSHASVFFIFAVCWGKGGE